jgi:hypothetical protein
MSIVWGTTITHQDLNLCEYYGLLIPARKALVADLHGPPRDLTSEEHGPIREQRSPRWRYLRRSTEPTLADNLASLNRSPKPLIERTVELHFDSAASLDGKIRDLRPSPHLLLECIAHVTPPKKKRKKGKKENAPFLISKRVRAESDSIWYKRGHLICDRRWLKPTQLEYWHGLSSMVALELNAGTQQRNPGKFRFEMTPEQANYGNWNVERFYVVGRGLRRHSKFSISHGSAGKGPGQDWYMALLMEGVRSRTGLEVMLPILHAEQQRGTNARKAAFLALASQSLTFSQMREFRLPDIEPSFWKLSTIALAYWRLRSADKTSDQAYRVLAKATGHKLDYVRRLVTAGNRLLRKDVDTR